MPSFWAACALSALLGFAANRRMPTACALCSLPSLPLLLGNSAIRCAASNILPVEINTVEMLARYLFPKNDFGQIPRVPVLARVSEKIWILRNVWDCPFQYPVAVDDDHNRGLRFKKR